MSKTIYTMVDMAAQVPPAAGKFLVAYDLDGKLKQMDSAGVVTEIGSGGGGGGVTPLAWADLKALADSAGMTPGAFYLITDFRTRHAIPYADPVEYWEEVAEPLLVQALDESSLTGDAKSAAFPSDSLKYELEDSTDQGGDRGRIAWRRDDAHDITAWYDWRGVKFRRWALSAAPFNPIIAYAKGDVALAADGNLYMAARNTSSPTDPASDPDNWVQMFKISSDPYVSPYPDPLAAGWNVGGCATGNLSVDAGDYEDYYTFGNSRTPNPDSYFGVEIQENNRE